ncbi:MAG: phage holin family protein [Actinobacteria bacterium]|nr:phage holin family protein [Actinomycetota bacterium]
MTTTGNRPSTEDYYRNERPGNRSVGQLMREITEDISSLIRKEIELAKQEVGESISIKAKGAVTIAIAGVFGLLALMFVLLALRDGLDTFLWQWVADLVTALVLLVCGGIGALIAKKKLQEPFKTELTKKTIKDDVQLAKSLSKRPGSAGSKTGV